MRKGDALPHFFCVFVLTLFDNHLKWQASLDAGVLL